MKSNKYNQIGYMEKVIKSLLIWPKVSEGILANPFSISFSPSQTNNCEHLPVLKKYTTSMLQFETQYIMNDFLNNNNKLYNYLVIHKTVNLLHGLDGSALSVRMFLSSIPSRG